MDLHAFAHAPFGLGCIILLGAVESRVQEPGRTQRAIQIKLLDIFRLIRAFS